jgi:UDP-3-O-[3-hydroxymyristoyl] N-acetylglucosamine deacetylase
MFGASMLGKITAHKSGHDLNNRLVRALNSDYSAWEIVHNGYKEIRAPQRPVASFG